MQTPKKHVCAGCRKSFALKSSLARHQRNAGHHGVLDHTELVGGGGGGEGHGPGGPSGTVGDGSGGGDGQQHEQQQQLGEHVVHHGGQVGHDGHALQRQ